MWVVLEILKTQCLSASYDYKISGVEHNHATTRCMYIFLGEKETRKVLFVY